MKNSNTHSKRTTANHKPYVGNCSKCGHQENRSNRNKFVCAYCSQQRKYIWGWETLRNKIVKRDGGCVVCGRSDVLLHVHHIDGDTTNNKPSNLQTKCIQCHLSNHRKAGFKVKGIEYQDFGVRLSYEEKVTDC